MKPTEKQVELVNSIKFIVSTWGTTNDINSSTHEGDISEELDKLWLGDTFSKEEVDAIGNDLYQLLRKVQKLEKDKK